MKMLDPWKARGLKMADDLPRKPLTIADIRTKRWTKKGNGRLLPLNSEAWYRLRRTVLAEVPLCQYCPPGVITPATEVDHKNNDPADNSRENLVSCCKPCHSIKTMADLYGRPARLGCDVDGWPINPSHHFNEAAVRPPGALAAPVDEKSPAVDGPEPTCTPYVNADCLKNRQS
ncbi:HNH endonuclease [Acidovorax sp. LjRoot74]|uniref:HNH endonuclease signature motif containing protein n=1 Tax=Acidovorax sp. LjRoot74 TaxID=3342337 RepID=UPI003ECDD59C